MKKRILTLALTAVMMLTTTVTAFADITTGLIGQYNFDGNFKNEVTGTEATYTGKWLTQEPVMEDIKPAFVNGVTNQSVLFEGLIQKYGLELTDAVPKTNTFTVSYDIYYNEYKAYSPVLFMAKSWDDADAQWISFGVGHKTDLSYAPGMWVHDVVNKNPDEWVDIWPATGVPGLIDESKNWLNWINITYVVDAGMVKTYVNGEDINTTGTINGTPFAEDATWVNVVDEHSKLYVGVNAFTTDTPLSAGIDNLYIYDRALTEEDVKELITGRDYDAAVKPEKEVETDKMPERNTAGSNQLVEVTEKPVETTASTDSGFSVSILLIIVLVVAIVGIIVVLFVMMFKKKSDYEFEDDEF